MKSDLVHFWDLTLVLTKKEIKVRYKNSVLGYLWSIANPLAFAFVFYVAFQVVMRIEMENYALFLIAGLFPWQWFSNSVSVSPGIFLGNSSIIKKINFPKSIVVLAIVLQDMAHYVMSLPVIALFLLIYGKYPYPAWAYGIPLLLMAQLLFTFGLSLLLASINLFFRDMEKLVNVFMILLFYFTPVLYSEAMIPAQYQSWIICNPLAPLMINWRGLFLQGSLNFGYLLASLLYGVLTALIGHVVYKKLSWRFAEVL